MEKNWIKEEWEKHKASKGEGYVKRGLAEYVVEERKYIKEDVDKFIDYLGHKTYWLHAFKPSVDDKRQDNAELKSLFIEDREALEKEIEKLNGQGLVCLAINERKSGKTKGEDVKEISSLVFDLDVPKERKEGYVSKLGDHMRAIDLARSLKSILEKLGIMTGLIVDSGNGSQVYVKVKLDLTKDRESTLNKVTLLENWVRSKLKDNVIQLDCITKDLNRRMKVPGTINKKDTKQKEDRVAKIIYHCGVDWKEQAEVNTRKFFEFEPSEKEVAKIEKDKKKTEGNDETRSAKEFGEVIKLIKKGKNKEEVFKEMDLFSKWASSPEQYKELTYKKALKVVEEDKDKPKEPNQFIESFIWDENKIIEKRIFPIDQHKNMFYFGVHLPKMVEEKDKDGKITGQKQEFRPCIITSDKKLVQITNRTKEDLAINFENIPYSLPRRWSLTKMKNFIEGRTEKVDGKKLLDKIKDQYDKYIHVRNPTWFKIFAVWDIGTYFYVLFEAYPFIENRGIAGTGKTKSMVVSSFITFNGGQIMVNPSESTLFRETEEIRGTKYIDEAEKLFIINPKTRQVESDPRVELINASYTKQAKVPRQEKIGNKFVTKWYAPYSPTQLSSINGLYGATETRAITRITTKSPNNDIRGELDPSEDHKSPIWNEIRDECYRFALENWEEVYKLYLNFPKDCGLKRRDLQIWKPLLTIAKLVSEEDYQEILKFAMELSDRRLDDLITESSFDYMCLHALKLAIISNESTKIYVDDIKQKFCDLKGSLDGLNDIYLNRNISNHLDKLGFKELRNRDKKASYFGVDLSTFNEIVNPICPNLVDLSTSSTPSPSLNIKEQEKGDDKVVINVDSKKEEVVMVAIDGENVDAYHTQNMENTSPPSKEEQEDFAETW
jgi:mRNA-degrading endonuclease YafQ of YafQ-DinJ toxin-antitoxin module